jgi:hypothetical protein
VASDPFTDSTPTSRAVIFDCEGDIVERLDRFGSFFSSEEILVLEGLWLARGDDSLSLSLSFSFSFSFSVLDDLDLGVSARTVLLVLLPSSFLDFRLDDERFTSVRILMLAFFLGFSELLSFSSSSTGVPLREDGWSRPVSGGLGGAWWFSVW